MRLVIAGGGTGGHLFPGLAIAEELLARKDGRGTERGREVLFLGARGGLEERVVPRHGYRLELLPSLKGGLLGLDFPRKSVRLCRGYLQARRAILEFHAQALVGLGGYASALPVLAAWGVEVPSLILEQNAIPGRATRRLAALAREIGVQFQPQGKTLAAPGKIKALGNPLRRRLVEASYKASARNRTERPVPEEPVLLVLGGSQGARFLNELIVRAWPKLKQAVPGVRVVLVAGREDEARAAEAFAAAGVRGKVLPFYEAMEDFYGLADVVLARAGATSLAEIAAFALPSILVPYPHAADGHQRANARVFVQAGAAWMLPQKTLQPGRLVQRIADVLRQPKRRRRMARAAAALAKPEAAAEAVNRLEGLAGLRAFQASPPAPPPLPARRGARGSGVKKRKGNVRKKDQQERWRKMDSTASKSLLKEAPQDGREALRNPSSSRIHSLKRLRMNPSATLPRQDTQTEADPFAGRRIHFMGAGGIGISALMELAHARGALVSGCDCSASGQVAHLRGRAVPIPVALGHDPAHAGDCDELVYSPAVPESHPEIARARALGRPVRVRMEMLGRLAQGARVVGVSGSHGKTTLTWMIAHLLIQAGRDPAVMVGGVVPSLGGNVRLHRERRLSGGGDWVLEVDESDNRLSAVSPALPVLTNIDRDHLEHYGGIEALQAAFTRFLASAARASDDPAQPIAALIGCGDDPRVKAALRAASARSGLPIFDYGVKRGRAFRLGASRWEGMRARFDLHGPFGTWRGLELPMPGRHNVLNALGAVAAAWRMGLSEEQVRAGLATCERVGRRFEIKGTARGVRVVDDYGHHPAEIAATIRAARASGGGRIAVLFQPHRYTRTAALMDDFALCFRDAEAVFVLPVFAASEAPIEGAGHEALAERIRREGPSGALALPGRAAAVARIRAWAREGDTVLIQGAGDVTRAAGELLAKLGSR